jgi:hypothetical protein
MNINNAFPSTYLKAADLQGRNINIAMHSVQFEEIGGEHKLILYFADPSGAKKDRGLVLNKTNASIISEMYGPETDDWPGKVITMYAAKVEFQGKIVPAIRVKLDVGTHAPQTHVNAPIQQPVQQAPHHVSNGRGSDIIDDQIPF